MIKNLQIRLVCDKRGKITSGIKTNEGYPKAVEYFVIEDFPEIEAEYGKQPKKLLVAFPINDIHSLFDCNYVLYSKNQTKIRQCDGENCIHRIDEEINGVKYLAGEESKCICDEIEDDKKRCRCVMYLKCWILRKNGQLLSPNIYLFQSGSENSAANIFSELEKVRTLNSEILQNIPFGLSVNMISSKDEAKKKFPIWTLQAIPRNQLGSNIEYLLPEKKKEISQSSEIGKDPIQKLIEEIKQKSDCVKIDTMLSSVEQLDRKTMLIELLDEKIKTLNIDYEIETSPL